VQTDERQNAVAKNTSKGRWLGLANLVLLFQVSLIEASAFPGGEYFPSRCKYCADVPKTYLLA